MEGRPRAGSPRRSAVAAQILALGGVRRGERSPWEALAAECKQAAVARERLLGRSKRGPVARAERALGEWALAVVA